MKKSLYDITSERLKAYVAQKGLRHSAVRQTVLEKLCLLPQPFTTEELLKACEKDRVSIGTIYNVLRLFVEARVVRTLDRQRGQRTATLYEVIADKKVQVQFICEECGRVLKFQDKDLVRMIYARKYLNFTTRQFTLFMYGECKKCKQKKVIKKTNKTNK